MPIKDEAARKEYQRQWREANREYIREYSRRPEVRERMKVACKAWKERNPDKVRARNRILRRRRRQRIRDAYNELKAGMKCLNPGCRWVGEYDPCVLDFHHVDPDNKAECVSQLLNSREAMLEEMKKCTVLCAVCHRLVTWGKLDASNLPLCNVDGLLNR